MISILLASYNGEKYIAKQIESLLNQTEQRFVLYICDDCSTDRTYEIEKKYAEQYPEKIVLYRNEKNTGSAKHNFIRMMIEHKDDYVMLCDQDDVWIPEKVEITLKKMQALEKEYGKTMPLLVHTDLRVVNEKLQLIHPSFARMMNADYKKTLFKNQIVQNTLTGCTVMYNKALAELIIGEPKFMVMHDWWLMLIASCFGHIEALPIQTILYRQHGNNLVGTRNMKSIGFMAKFFLKRKQIKQALRESYQQTEAFLCLYGKKMSEKQYILARKYCEIDKLNKAQKIIRIFYLDTFKNGLLRKIAQILYI